MFEIERRKIISEMLKKNGSVKTSELVKAFKVSGETVRKDIVEMEKAGLLRRVHGGALPVSHKETYMLKSFKERLGDYPELKKELSTYAAAFVNEGDIIAVDEGTTAIDFADALAERFERLTVLTQSLDVVKRLSHKENFRIIVTGGVYYPEENSLTGNVTENVIRSFQVMKSFIFPLAISLENGIMDGVEISQRIQKAMMNIADKVYVMADSSKFEKNALCKVSPLSGQYTYITDSKIDEKIVKLYSENGIRIEVSGK